jgi:hypothetical protein
MHIASPYDINIPVDNSELTPEQVQNVQYLMGRDRVLFNPIGFKSIEWTRQLNKRQTAEDEPVPERQQHAMAVYQDRFLSSLFDDDEDAGAVSTTTKPVTETIVIESDEDGQPDASKKQKTDAAAGAAAAAGKERIPRQLPAWAQPQPPKATAKAKTPRTGPGASAQRRRPRTLTPMDRASSARDFDPRTHPVRPQSPTRHEEDTHSPDDAPRPESPDATQDGGATRTATPEPDPHDAPGATEPLTAEQWLADELAKDAAAEAARRKNIHRVTGTTVTRGQKADIADLLRHLKIYCS